MRPTVLALSMLGVLGTLPAFAQSPSAEPEQDSPDVARTLQRVEVIGRSSDLDFAESTFSATKTETAILDLPMSVSAVTKEVIRDQGLHRLNDVTPFVAGANEFSVYDDITLRGFRSSDDRRVNGMRTYNNFWSQPSIAHLERIEVIKGPAAATFGSASPGGVINLVTKKPLDEARRELTLSLGEFQHRYGALDLTGPLNQAGNLLYRLNAAVEDAGSFREQIGFETRTLAPSFTLLPREGTRINLDMVWIDAESILDRGQPNVRGADTLGLVPISVSLTQPGDRLDTQSLSTHLTVEQALGDDWTVVASHMAYRYEEELVEHRVQRYLTDTLIELSYGDRDSRSDADTTSLYLNGYFQTGPVLHNLVVGIDHAERTEEQVDFSAGGVGTFDVLAPEYLVRDVSSYPLAESSWSPYETGLNTTGYYLQDQMSIGNWQVLAGLRYDTYRTTAAEGGVASAPQADSQLSPRLGVVYKLDPDRSVYASWITGFEPADPYLNSALYGGPFDPSDSELLEVGYKHLAWGGDLLFTASVYELLKNNSIVYANDEANPDLYLQRGQERARGVELEASGRIGERLRLIANYAFNDAEVSKDTDPDVIGRRKENAPRHTATLWGRWQATQRLGFGLGAQYVGDRSTFVDTLTLPAYTTYNAGVYWTGDSFEASVLVKNLTDEVHWTGGYNFGRVFPGDPRTATFNINWRF